MTIEYKLHAAMCDNFSLLSDTFLLVLKVQHDVITVSACQNISPEIIAKKLIIMTKKCD